MTPWEKMTLAVALVYVVFKALTFRRLAFGRAVGYALFWPGMDARPFEETREGGGFGLLAWGLCKMAFGVLLLTFRTGVEAVDLLFVFAGIGFLVHLGGCDVLAGFWRGRGVEVERLFPNPAASRSLGEFWGRRWNRAFHTVVRSRIYRPVAARWGRGWGVLATFVFSGILHDLLISVPVGAGYGLPTLYFVLHGALVAAERRWSIESRTWTLFWVLAPLPLLFHPWFVEGILKPLL